MANNESALNMVGLVAASDYLASLLARLAALEQGNGVAAVSAVPELLAAQPDPRSLYFGTPLEYGAAHQFGREETHLPERPYLGLSEEDKQSVLETLEGYVVP
ncbi:virion morphogenesis protein [Aeromonas sp. CU5]|uniref:phage virion morphogenesis protein n=1 Tax=Aeromonas sp. CU5 TaxID=2033033 RepID=UPI000BFD388A|nr:phage virion morphogenesis protein [Aeromonas sp. CU5]ATL91900.1 virion morphogenesis protein [Aeromonas sp. CU5]